MDPEDPEDPDAEARQILTSAEELLVLGKIQKALEQAQIARDYYLESGLDPRGWFGGWALKKLGVI